MNYIWDVIRFNLLSLLYQIFDYLQSSDIRKKLKNQNRLICDGPRNIAEQWACFDFCSSLLPFHPFPELSRAFTDIFFEFLVEIVHVFLADLLGNFVDLQFVLQKQLLGVLDTHVIDIGVEAFANGFVKNLAEVGAVIAKERSDGL